VPARRRLAVHVGLGLVDELLDLLKKQFGLKVVPATVATVAIWHQVWLAVGGALGVHVVWFAHVVVVLQMLLVHIF
jgi:hypothetical protein